ncbi:MAG: hypothetical protein R3B70_10465 [Polyangiaceae bacterium]
MPPPVTAKPQGFLLKMRLMAPDGTPFSGKKYRVKWGAKMVPEPPAPPRTTGGNGDIVLLLEAPGPTPPAGVLHMIEATGPQETIVWSIPLQIAQDPAPTGMPGIDRAPAPPPPTAPPSEVKRYDDEVRSYRVRVIGQLRERLYEFWQAWSELRAVLGLLPPPPLQPANDDELWLAWQMFMKVFALATKGYEAAWRLYNMADLPTQFEPTMPFLASDLEMLRRAMDRFAYRHGQETPIDWSTIVERMDEHLERILRTHDQRHDMNPVRYEEKP